MTRRDKLPVLVKISSACVQLSSVDGFMQSTVLTVDVALTSSPTVPSVINVQAANLI